MIPTRRTSRRTVLRGMMGGGAIGVGLPLLDCFLDRNGTAMADGAPLPVCFGTWSQGLGFNPGFWEPKIVGSHYDNNVQLKALDPFRDRINIYSGMKVSHDGKPPSAHDSSVCVIGGVAQGNPSAPSIDVLVSDAIGQRTRFRSLEVSCDGTPMGQSRRTASAMNPPEVSPAALYTRIFGPDFKDPNAADFTPDPIEMARRSVISAVAEHRQSFVRDLGASDRARLDEYFTSLRQFEQQLDLQLQKPARLEACSVPGKPADATPGTLIDDARANGKLFFSLLAHALACGQTRVINIGFSPNASNLRRAGSAMTFHMYTHEEATDEKLGYQPNSTWFQAQVLEAFVDFLTTLDSIREGDRTLLDRILVFYSTDHGYAKIHSFENIPLITAGGAGGRIKTGYHLQAQGDTVTRVGFTSLLAMGVPVNNWGIDSNLTSRPFSEVLA